MTRSIILFAIADALAVILVGSGLWWRAVRAAKSPRRLARALIARGAGVNKVAQRLRIAHDVAGLLVDREVGLEATVRRKTPATAARGAR